MSGSAQRLLDHAIDIHVHTSPDLVQRRLSDIVAATEAREAGMRGLLIKNHISETASRARIAAEASGADVYGALVLNHFVGGLNVHAVRAALTLGAKVIFMPTFHAAHHLSHHANMPLFQELMHGQLAGIAILDGSGKLVPELTEVLAAIAEAGATLATGHIAPTESAALTTAALAAGVPRIILTHPLSPLVGMSVEQVVEISRPEGVYVEHSYLDIMGFVEAPVPLQTVVTVIRKVGLEKTILSSDGGQAKNPLRPVEMMGRFAADLAENGFPAEDVRLMLRDNPARALGISL